MELVATHSGPSVTESRVGQRLEKSVAEMQPVISERCLQRQQTGHHVTLAITINQAPAQHHVSAAFSIDGSATCRCCGQTVPK